MSSIPLLANPVLTGLTEAGEMSSGEAALFWVLAPLIALLALGLLFSKRAVHAAVSIAGVMVGLAFLYVAQDAPFLGIAQIVVYTGAIMMLFLFVLMLVGVDASDSLVETIRGQRFIGWAMGGGLGLVLISVVTKAITGTPRGLETANADTNPVGVSRVIFGDFIITFEVVGVLLVTAALGALVLTHRQGLRRRITQKDRVELRMRSGEHPVPLPAPGVYARTNAMDVPALDPEGKPIEASVSRILRIRGQERDLVEVRSQIDLDGEVHPPAALEPVDGEEEK